ncbi:ribonuclease H-like domain-containing protein [Tanacetum coccineum]
MKQALVGLWIRRNFNQNVAFLNFIEDGEDNFDVTGYYGNGCEMIGYDDLDIRNRRPRFMSRVWPMPDTEQILGVEFLRDHTTINNMIRIKGNSINFDVQFTLVPIDGEDGGYGYEVNENTWATIVEQLGLEEEMIVVLMLVDEGGLHIPTLKLASVLACRPMAYLKGVFEVIEIEILFKEEGKRIGRRTRNLEFSMAKRKKHVWAFFDFVKTKAGEISRDLRKEIGSKKDIVPIEILANALGCFQEKKMAEMGYGCKESDVDDSSVNDRFKTSKGFHAVPPPYTVNYIPSRPDLSFAGLDDSAYKTKVSETITTTSKTNKDSLEKPKTIRPSAPIIEDWDTNSDNDSVFRPKSDQTKPKFTKINFVKSDENVKSVNKENIHKQVEYPRKSQSPKGNRRNRNGMMTKKLGNGFEFIKKSCIHAGFEDQQEMLLTIPPKAVDHTCLKDLTMLIYKADSSIFDSGCSRHMTGNKSFLTDYQEVYGGFVAFAGSPKGGKITRKGKIRTGKLDFEDVYFVKELKFNLFSVSQMCDKKNGVLFTETECLILSPDFKLLDESQVLLKVPRQNNMYSFNLKNVVPSGGIENQINHRVKIIRCDNGTEFKNNEMNQFYQMKGIKREFSIARTPQQNGVAERKNRTLIEAARTMLADSLLPTIFWAEAVNTACYVQNIVLVIKPHNKTPYELLIGSGPEWLFDIDSLTKSMNYEPVTAGNQTNGDAGIEENDNAGQAGQEKAADHEYILLPFLTSNSSSTQSSDDKDADEVPGKGDEGVNKVSRSDDQERTDSSTQDINTAGPSINTATTNINTGSLNINIVSPNDPNMPSLEETGIFDGEYNDEDVGAEADLNNLETTMNVSPIPTTRIYKDHPKD